MRVRVAVCDDDIKVFYETHPAVRAVDNNYKIAPDIIANLSLGLAEDPALTKYQFSINQVQSV